MPGWNSCLCLMLVVLVTGCSALPATIPADATDIAVVKHSTVTLTHQNTQGFMFATPAKALVDAGMATWVEPGKAITWSRVLRENRVPDFTAAVAQGFRKEVGERFEFLESGRVEPFDQSADFSRLATQYDSDYTLEIRTLFGSFVYGPMSWNTYNLRYSADAVLVRRSDQQAVWKSMCGIGPEDGNPLQVPGRDFLSEDGDRLNIAAAYATDYCGRKLAREFMDVFVK
jgi:hypothetical protein